MYKDKDKQREANRQAQAKFKAKGITEGITNQGITGRVLPSHYHQPHCNAPSHVEQFAKGVSCSCRKPERTAQGNIRVSKPGDSDSVPMCETTRAYLEGMGFTVVEPKEDMALQSATKLLRGVAELRKPAKRGKDIKVFEDLPMDVQRAIKVMSTTNGKIDQAEKDRRTGIAIRYVHQFPDDASPSWIPAIVSVSTM